MGPRVAHLMPLAAVAASLACGGDGGTGPPERTPASLVKVSGDGQAGVVGAGLAEPLVVRVADGAGSPLGGVTVQWSAPAGSVQPSSATTGSDGRAAGTWTLGTAAGPQTATATVTGVPSATFGATAAAGPLADVAVAEDSVRLRSLGEVVALEAAGTDTYGNPVEGVAIGYASRDEAVAVVDAAGEVTAVAEGETWVVASAAGATPDSTRVVVEPELARIEISPGTATLAVDDTMDLTASTYDALSSPVAGVAITWTSLSPGVAEVDPAGRVVAVAAGEARVVASSGGVADTATATVVAGLVTRQWRGGAAAAPERWSEPANWSPAGPVTVRTRAVIGPTDHDPVMAADGAARSVEVAAGAELFSGQHTLEVVDLVRALGPIRGDGTLRVTGDPAAVSGVLLPPLTVTGHATLDAPATAFLAVRVVDGTLSNGGQTLRVVVP